MTGLSFLNDIDWNEDMRDDGIIGDMNLVVYSRDWTIETIVNQIHQKNIDLNPSFQRRNVWDDKKRSRLIESLIINTPIPEIVLAEDKTSKKSFIVIDGKQRLSALAGFVDPTNYGFWDKPHLTSLTVRKNLNGLDYLSLKNNYTDEFRQLQNSAIRTTIITNYISSDVLYDVFYRLNTGSMSLVGQELRQVLNKGPFADYLIESTSKKQPLHTLMRLNGPDKRLRDAELLLRSLSFEFFGDEYTGNLSKFLDKSMGIINKKWEDSNQGVREYHEEFNNTIKKLITVFPESETRHSYSLVGRKFIDGKWESRFNKVLFEVQLYYFIRLSRNNVEFTKKNKSAFIKDFKKLSQSSEFRITIEASTKNRQPYFDRYRLFRDLINKVFSQEIEDIPVKPTQTR